MNELKPDHDLCIVGSGAVGHVGKGVHASRRDETGQSMTRGPMSSSNATPDPYAGGTYPTSTRARPLRRLAAVALAAVLWPGAALTLHAGSYPDRPVQVVVPFPPAGSIDVLGRLLSRGLENRLGQSFVVDNRPGGGTTIGAQAVARAKPDGYSLLLSSNSTYTLSPVILNRPAYDPITAFEPIAMIANVALVVLVNGNSPIESLADLVAAAKAAPQSWSYGSFGNGTVAHFAGEMLNARAGTTLTHVPYRGSAMALTDLIGGQIPVAIDTVVAAVPHIRSGKVKPIVVTTLKRSELLPGTRTIAESGYPGFDLRAWIALVGPQGLPADVRSTLVTALAEVMADTGTRRKLADAGFESAWVPLPAWEKLVGGEIERLRAVARRSGIKAD